MDITSLFKASVKTVRLKLPPDSIRQPDKNRILRKKKTNTHELWDRAKSLKHQVTLLRNFLLENRTSYMRLAEHLKNSSPQMTNDERDLIDRESDKILSTTAQLVKELRLEWVDLRVDQQLKEFLSLVIDSLAEYANAIRKISHEQRQFRLRRQMETIGYVKLQPKMKTEPLSAPLEPDPVIGTVATSASKRSDVVDTGHRSVEKTVTAQSMDDLEDSTMDEENEANDLSPEDIQMFESENVQLYNELKGLSEEVEQIQRNVCDIAHLQDIFSEKISLQKTDVDRISTTVVGTTENMKDANEQIGQAIRRNAGLRVWVLFFLIVMSFTLLFLDWYND
ncbi:syntaxin-18 [Anopheles bellator]|uniref:syntaxin-18 n=1 Tax=Anopheles bellator TaxID=139047 RepID=UPI00264778CA|nr:syntaxin-18 [Anopheles bellator]